MSLMSPNDELDEYLLEIKVFNETNIDEIVRGIGMGTGYFRELNETINKIIRIIRIETGTDEHRAQLKYFYNKLRQIKPFYATKNLNIWDLINEMLEKISNVWRSISTQPL